MYIHIRVNMRHRAILLSTCNENARKLTNLCIPSKNQYSFALSISPLNLTAEFIVSRKNTSENMSIPDTRCPGYISVSGDYRKKDIRSLYFKDNQI